MGSVGVRVPPRARPVRPFGDQQRIAGDDRGL